MMLRWPSKDPSDVLDYSLDWSGRLPSGDTITSSFWVVDPDETDGVAINSDVISELATTVWLSAGVADRKYVLTNRIMTAGGRTMEMSVGIFVIEK